jgi:hypothetical protein
LKGSQSELSKPFPDNSKYDIRIFCKEIDPVRHSGLYTLEEIPQDLAFGGMSRNFHYKSWKAESGDHLGHDSFSRSSSLVIDLKRVHHLFIGPSRVDPLIKPPGFFALQGSISFFEKIIKLGVSYIDIQQTLHALHPRSILPSRSYQRQELRRETQPHG